MNISQLTNRTQTLYDEKAKAPYTTSFSHKHKIGKGKTPP